MPAAKPVLISVRPFQAANLCFETGGIMDLIPAQLGVKVASFDFQAFYSLLGSMPTVAGDLSRLLFDFPQIDGAVTPVALAALRREPRRAALNSAINSRQNAYFAKYGNAPAIIAQMTQAYSPFVPDSKPNRLERLSSIATTQWSLLENSYKGAKREGVVTSTTSVLCSDTASYGYAATGGIGQQVSVSAGSLDAGPFPTPPNPPGPWDPPSWPAPCTAPQREPRGSNLPSPVPPTPPNDTWGIKFTGNAGESSTLQKSSSYQASSSADRAYQSQTIVNTDYGYRVPYYEAEAQFQRAQISLIDQRFAQFMYGQNLPHLARVFANELQSIDANVYRLQVSYLNSILLSPISGIVTGLFKNAGDAVKAGETVIRVEDNSSIYIVATVIYRGPIVVGDLPPAPPVPNSTFTLNTKLFGLASLPSPVVGTVVSARGRNDEDKWDLIIRCSNLDAGGNPIFPIGYNFDYDDTDISIS